MSRKLFCEICPLCYHISVWKRRMGRYLADMFTATRFASAKQAEPLPIMVKAHRSVIRRKLANVDAALQENKATNLALAAPKLNGIVIRPGETFSFWRLVGLTSARRGYKAGLVIRNGRAVDGIGGGMCQMSNLIHWLVLHSPLDIVEHHHHDRYDLFPDCERKVPFGTGTSVSHNYIDYRFRNNSSQCFQLLIWSDGDELHGELRCEAPLPHDYRIECADEHFCEEGGAWFRNNRIYRSRISRESGQPVGEPELIKRNHARVMYDAALIDRSRIRQAAAAADAQ